MKKIQLISLLVIMISSWGHAQTKAELQAQIAAKDKTIDSLKKVMANMENIIESRDRSISFIKADKEKLTEEKEVLLGKIAQKNQELVDMRRRAEIGLTRLMTLNNTRSTLKVPEGKYYTINQFVCDYSIPKTADLNSGAAMGEEIHVFLQAVNGDVLTDYVNNIYGPQVYCSQHPERTMQFPMMLSENTSISIIVLKGDIGSMTPYEGNVYCSFTEKDNH